MSGDSDLKSCGNPLPSRNLGAFCGVKISISKSPTIKKSDTAFGAQLLTFAANIGNYTLGLTAAQITAQNNDAQYFNYTLLCQGIMQAAAQQWTAWKNLLRAGNAASTPPAAVTLPAAVPPVAPGIKARFRALIQQVKNHPSYNDAMGQALGIEGDIQSGPDLMTIQPVPAKWTYRAIYRIGDQSVGQWSSPVSVMVGG